MRTITHLLFSLLFAFTLLSCGGTGAETNSTTPTSPQEQEKERMPESQPATPPIEEVESPQTTEEAITDIQEKYAAITAKTDAGTLRIDTINFQCEDDPSGGVLMRYYGGDELLVLQYEFGGEHGGESDRVYFSGGEPFFVLREEFSWQFGGPLKDDNQPNTIDSFKEERFYFQGSTIIKALRKSYELKSWEKPVNSEDVPNQSAPEWVGKKYDKVKMLPEWIKGEVGC